MNEPLAAKPRFTRRRLVLGAVLLVLVLAVAGVGFKVFDGTSTSQIQISVKLVEPLPGQIITTAMITVSNASPTRSMVALVGTNDFKGRPPCLLRDEYVDWRPQMVFTGPGPQFRVLAPLSAERGPVDLPVDGRVRKVAVYSFVQPRPLSAPLRKVREWWWNHVQSWSPKFTLVESDQSIQCPRRLPDGTTVPPHIVTRGKPETK